MTDKSFSEKRLSVLITATLIIVKINLLSFHRNKGESSLEHFVEVNVSSLIEERVSLIVTRAFDEYGGFNTGEEYNRVYSSVVRLVLEIGKKLKDSDRVNIQPLKKDIFDLVFVFGFDKEWLKRLLELVVKSLTYEATEGKVDVKDFVRYINLIAESLSDLNSFSRTGVIEHLLELDQYGVSTYTGGSTKAKVFDTRNNPGSRLINRYSDIFKEKVDLKIAEIANSYHDINSITSDSSVDSGYLEEVNIDLLTATFAGGGKSIYQSLVGLFNAVADFGGFQGSWSGSVEYFSTFSEYTLAMSYGKKINLGLLGEDFGRFDRVYAEEITNEQIPGLNFLEPIYKTRLGRLNRSESNPISEKFKTGVKDRYKVSPVIPYSSLILESMYVECLKIGDEVESLVTRPLSGIGDTTYLLSILGRIFPPSSSSKSRQTGFTSGVYKLLLSYRKLSALYGYEPKLPELSDKLSTISSLLLDFSQVIKGLGFKDNSPVPNLSLTYHTPSKESIKRNLLRVGFSEVEVDNILSVKDFKELIAKFAPLTDSQDVISFFRAYELTKLIYTFGGQEAIDLYINYLYGVDTSILNLLRFLDIDRSMSSKAIASDYPKLIGYLITLTYAINPSQLIDLQKFLKSNNLNLLESITYLVNKGQDTVLKKKEDIDMLGAVAAQMVTTSSKDYSVQKPLWNRLIQEASGRAEREDLEGLYNKTQGVIPEELNNLLNTPPPLSTLGKLMDGVRGGSFTSLLRYCNIFGLLYSLSPYRNSGQLVNNHVSDYGRMVNLVSSLEKLSERLSLSSSLLETNIDSTPNTDLIKIQNKGFSSFIKLISGTLEFAGNEPIQESPGIGNSRIANGVRLDNSLTPEESELVKSRGLSLGSFSEKVRSSESSSFVRFAQSNVLSLVNLTQNELLSLQEDSSIPIKTTSSSEEEPPDYVNSYSPRTSTTPGLLSLSPQSQFDAVKSCQRFGGTDCQEIKGVCKVPYNKSLYPEVGYGSAPEFVQPSVPIDRPLGSQISMQTTYLDSQSPFSKAGISNKVKNSGVFKSTELLCASLDDPFDYSSCISLLKCKKYDKELGPLNFCPETLAGGRLD